MLNVGGRKVYPVELERLLQVHAGVAGVRIWGEATQIQGDKLCAEVELVGSQHATTDTLRKWCMENISPHKVPTFTAKHGLRPPVLRGAHSCHRVS